MSNSKSSDVFYLIKSMTKAEKRAFKLYATRGSGTQHLFVKLFDLIDTKTALDDDEIIKKLQLNSTNQYANLKRHLYSQILSTLRMLNVEKKPNIKIREYIDMAYILYDKGLYMQALKILNTAKKLCHQYGTDLSLLTILEIEKTIHSRHITRLKKESFEALITDVNNISESISNRFALSNLKIILHRNYIQQGHAKNKAAYDQITDYFHTQINSIVYEELRVMEKIYYCQCYVWYNYVVDNFENCLRYAQQWVELFKSHKDLPRRDYNLFLRGYHYVLTSAYNLNDQATHAVYLEELEAFRKTNYAKFNKNNKIFSFLYVHTGRLNQAFLDRDFEAGLNAIPNTLKRLKRYDMNLDQHKVMVLHYKIAWMYICAQKTTKALPYLEGIIDMQRKSLREDIQSYARLLHLMALYDLEDYEAILNKLRKYQYYFQQAKEINQLQKTAFKYFQKVSKAPILEKNELHRTFLKELAEIKQDKFEKRAFIYLDIVYWIERQLR